MKRLHEVLALFLISASLGGCSAGLIGRGVDPRDTGPGAGGAVASNNNMNMEGAVSLLSGPTLMNWLSRTFMPDEHSDVPPPPAPQNAGGERAIVAQDCTNPAHRHAAILPCE